MRARALFALLPLLALHGAEQPAHQIRVDASGFESREQDITKVCLSAVAELQKYCRELPTENVVIQHGSKNPITLFQRNPQGEIVVRLNTGKTFWSQYAYQVAHEICHVHCGFREGPRENLWFEESICETASLFCLRAMAKTWQAKPPYPNWVSYAPALAKYADEVITKRTYKAEFETKGLAKFFREHEPEFRSNATDRQLNGAIALALLPYFEEQPTRWAALHWLNATARPDNESFSAYLKRWGQNTPAEHQETVRGLQKLFGL